MEQKAFTVNIPSKKYIREADYVGIYSGQDENKFESTGLTPVKSDMVDAPYVDEFPMAMMCKLIHTHEIGLHTQFIGEILDVIAEEEVLAENGRPDINKVEPVIYDNASRYYYGIGNKVLKAYSQRKESNK